MLLFLKLGGSLITDKTRQQTVRLDVLTRLSGEIARARQAHPTLQLLIGHGSGSFGHTEASRYGTKRGVFDAPGWLGFSKVSHVANLLNRHVMDALCAADLPVMRFQPSAGAIACNGEIASFADEPIQRALAHGLIPVVHGDVAFDSQLGGTILSTERIFSYLAQKLQPQRILLAGIESGVLTHFPGGKVLSNIHNHNLAQVRSVLNASAAVDVTGGMESKVLDSLKLANNIPGLQVQIYDGQVAALTEKLLLGQVATGTIISADALE